MLIYYRAKRGNFGDDLNATIWDSFLSKDLLQNPDRLVLGIGTIFNNANLPASLTKGKEVLILGSGAGYAPLPFNWKSFRLLAVRGPLTAALIENPGIASTDPAILVSQLPQFTNPQTPKKDVVFIPHHLSVEGSCWEEVAADAGMKYVNPEASVDEVIGGISSAKIVVTEAMHGAIIADALRVPWIQVVASPAIYPFKWLDWAGSVGLTLNPHPIPPSSAWEFVKNGLISRDSQRNGGSFQIDVKGQLDQFAVQFGSDQGPAASRRQDGEIKAGAHKSIGKIILRKTLPALDANFRDRAAEALHKVLREKSPLLSSENIWAEGLDRVMAAIHVANK